MERCTTKSTNRGCHSAISESATCRWWENILPLTPCNRMHSDFTLDDFDRCSASLLDKGGSERYIAGILHSWTQIAGLENGATPDGQKDITYLYKGIPALSRNQSTILILSRLDARSGEYSTACWSSIASTSVVLTVKWRGVYTFKVSRIHKRCWGVVYR